MREKVAAQSETVDPLRVLDVVLPVPQGRERSAPWLTTIARHLAHSCAAHIVLFVRIDGDGTIVPLSCAHGLPRRAVNDASIEVMRVALKSELARPGRLRATHLSRRSSLWADLARRHRLMAVPLSANGRVVCVAIVGWRHPVRPSAHTRTVVRTLLRQVAAAIESCELQRRLHATQSELRRQGRESKSALEHTYGELRQAREELRTLAMQVEHVRERERSRIARELHDELGQALTSLKMDLSQLTRRRGALHDGAVRELASAIDGMVVNVRRIANELRPHLLDHLGLVAALQSQTQDFVRRTGVPCRFRCRGTPHRVDGERATAMFRIFQELLTNIARHADATRVQITLTIGATVARLEVDDNGRGIAQSGSDARLGIVGMRERAAAFGGRIAIAPASPHGTRVRVRIPLSRVEEAI